MTTTAPHPDLFVGPDGVVRCSWPGLSHADYRDYHDREWGKPVHGETALLERLCLEGFQTGLSWLTILRKRAAFRAAFAGFDADTVARFDESDVERLLSDESIVRNRRKIEATIQNARATVALRESGGMEELL
jgi:DNA-3-methyladenine glycosylase I